MKSDRRRARGLLIACEPGNETEEGLLITHQRGVTYSLPSGARLGSAGRVCRTLLQADLRPVGDGEGLPWQTRQRIALLGVRGPAPSRQDTCTDRAKSACECLPVLFSRFALRGGGSLGRHS